MAPLTRQARRLAAACTTALLLVAAPAMGVVRSGSATDALGDQANPQRDITAVSATFDTAGTLTATVTFAAAPTAAGSGLLFAAFGTPSGGSCGAPLVGVGASTDPAAPDAVAVPSDDTTLSLPATRSVAGPAITLTATNGRFTDAGFACVSVRLRDPAGADYDALSAPLTLAEPASPPPPPASPPPAAPAPPAAPPKPLTRAQKLTRALRACAARKAPARAACRRAARARFGPPLTRAQKLARALKACSARRGAARARCTAAARAAYAPPRSPAPGAGPLAGRVFYYPGADAGNLCGGTCWLGYAFVDDRWARTSFPSSGGFFAPCGSGVDGCVEYTYAASTRSGRVGGKDFTLSPDGTTVRAGLGYGLGAFLPPGTRVNLFLKGITISGFSPALGQTVITDWLAMGADGRFVRSTLALGSFGDINAPVSSHFSAAPPDARGTYQFLAGGQVRFTYDTGEVTTSNVFVLDSSAEKAPTEGLFLGGTAYFRPG